MSESLYSTYFLIRAESLSSSTNRVANIKCLYNWPFNIVEFLCGEDPGWSGSLDSGRCYKYHNEMLTYEEATRVCARAGHNASLVDPRTLSNQVFIYLLGILLSYRWPGTL